MRNNAGRGRSGATLCSLRRPRKGEEEGQGGVRRGANRRLAGLSASTGRSSSSTRERRARSTAVACEEPAVHAGEAHSIRGCQTTGSHLVTLSLCALAALCIFGRHGGTATAAESPSACGAVDWRRRATAPSLREPACTQPARQPAAPPPARPRAALCCIRAHRSPWRSAPAPPPRRDQHATADRDLLAPAAAHRRTRTSLTSQSSPTRRPVVHLSNRSPSTLLWSV